jgi:hypothetical protein
VLAVSCNHSGVLRVAIAKTYLMFAGGSMEGTNSRATYATPTRPTMEPAMMRRTPSCRRMEPTKM